MKQQPLSRQSVAGYTLIEMLVVIIIISVLATIAVPGWLTLLNRQRLSAAQDKALTVMRDAQANAQREKRSWQACFWDDGSKVFWAFHPVTLDGNCELTKAETLLDSNSKAITIDPAKSDLIQQSPGYYQVQFEFDGTVVEGQSGKKITFKPRNATQGPERCVYVATLLGNIRAANNCN